MDLSDLARSASDAVARILDVAPGLEPRRDPTGKGLHHALFLLGEVATGTMSLGKANRWLAYAQCVLVYEGVSTLSDEKERNRPRDAA